MFFLGEETSFHEGGERAQGLSACSQIELALCASQFFVAASFNYSRRWNEEKWKDFLIYYFSDASFL
jgi:hypothetical protein